MYGAGAGLDEPVRRGDLPFADEDENVLEGVVNVEPLQVDDGLKTALPEPLELADEGALLAYPAASNGWPGGRRCVLYP